MLEQSSSALSEGLPDEAVEWMSNAITAFLGDRQTKRLAGVFSRYSCHCCGTTLSARLTPVPCRPRGTVLCTTCCWPWCLTCGCLELATSESSRNKSTGGRKALWSRCRRSFPMTKLPQMMLSRQSRTTSSSCLWNFRSLRYARRSWLLARLVVTIALRAVGLAA